MKTAIRSRVLFRGLALCAVAAGFQYIVWRYAASLNTAALWLSIPFVIAETYGILDMALFLFMMWKPKTRSGAPEPIEGTVDVFITTYNEEPGVVRRTAEAACRIRWPDKRVFILDDGARPSIEGLAGELGCSYITRGEEWKDKPRHAKAGNVNNALNQTSGDFILILDADQIPSPNILERTLGYFADPLCAFVQTPQKFYNIPPGDPFGTDAPLFYGPILEGKDGWNAAFFCGSNAVLRREALMQLGLTTYVREVELAMRRGLRELRRDVGRLPAKDPERKAIRRELLRKLAESRRALKSGGSLGSLSEEILGAIRKASEKLTGSDLAEISATLKELGDGGDLSASLAASSIASSRPELAAELASRELAGIAPERMRGLDLTRGDEAIPVQALDTASITEDMATALRLHALGFRSVFHNEVLAQGLAPEDLGTSFKQRLRWAQGTIQVLVKENPLTIRGLSLAQRLMYFSTIFSYFSGFSNAILLVAPIVWFFSAVAPVSAWSPAFFLHLLPFLALNRLAYFAITKGLAAWRSEQFSLALFPLWIKAVVSVLFGRRPSFVVTAKQRQAGTYLRLVWPQILVIVSTLCGIVYAGFALLKGWGDHTLLGYAVNSVWGIYNCLMLSALVRAALYQPPADWRPSPPDFGAALAGKA